jgi:hypothetical protein
MVFLISDLRNILFTITFISYPTRPLEKIGIHPL